METPVPPASAPPTVAGPYGLAVDVNDAGALPYAGGVYSVTYRWSLPTCSVTQVTAAEAAFERAECSARGLCDRSSGACECFPGYAGYNCAQQTVVV